MINICLGDTYKALNDNNTALQLYLHAYKSDPNNSTLCHSIGNCYNDVEDYENALDYYITATELDDNLPDTYYAIAKIYEEQENNMSALVNYKKAAKSGHLIARKTLHELKIKW